MSHRVESVYPSIVAMTILAQSVRYVRCDGAARESWGVSVYLIPSGEGKRDISLSVESPFFYIPRLISTCPVPINTSSHVPRAYQHILPRAPCLSTHPSTCPVPIDTSFHVHARRAVRGGSGREDQIQDTQTQRRHTGVQRHY